MQSFALCLNLQRQCSSFIWEDDNNCSFKFTPSYIVISYYSILVNFSLQLTFLLWMLDYVLIGVAAKGFGLPVKVSNVKVILNGGQQVTFLKPDGYFSLYPTFLLSPCINFSLHLIHKCFNYLAYFVFLCL